MLRIPFLFAIDTIYTRRWWCEVRRGVEDEPTIYMLIFSLSFFRFFPFFKRMLFVCVFSHIQLFCSHRKRRLLYGSFFLYSYAATTIATDSMVCPFVSCLFLREICALYSQIVARRYMKGNVAYAGSFCFFPKITIGERGAHIHKTSKENFQLVSFSNTFSPILYHTTICGENAQ